MPLGLGFSPDEDPSQPPAPIVDDSVAVPPPASPVDSPKPALDPFGVDQPDPVLEASKSPLGAIGAVLLNFQRGMSGDKLYTDELKDRRQQREAMELKKLETGTEAMSRGLQLMKNVPSAQRGQVAQQYGKLFEHFLPGFTDTLIKASEQPQATAAQIAALGEHAAQLISIAGDVPGALKLSQNTEFMKQLDEQADRQNAPDIAQAFKRAVDVLKQTPGTNALLEQTAKNGWTLAELQDPKVQQGLGLTPSMVNTISRNKEVQSMLRPYGFIPQADADKAAEAGPKAVFNAESGKVEFATIDDIAKNPKLQPVEAAPEKPKQPNYESRIAVDPKTGEVLPQRVRFDSSTGKATLEDGSPVPPNYVVSSASVSAQKPGDLGLGQGSQSQIEQQISAENDSIANIDRVIKDFKPEYLQKIPNLKANTLAEMEKYGATLTPAQKGQVQQFATYKQNAIQALNEGIKALTGAVMTIQEADRLRKQFPDLENDSPTEFKAKAENIREKTQLAVSRRQWMLKHGAIVDFGSGEPATSLDSFAKMRQDYGDQQAKMIRAANPQISKEELRAKVLQKITEEFGANGS